MAQRLLMSFSSKKCQRCAGRHVHTCMQKKGTEKFVENIQPALNESEAKDKEKEVAEKESEFALDTSILMEGDIDDSIRNAANRCKEFDRDNLGSKLFSLIFPGGIDTFIKLNREDKPDEADVLAVKIEKLGTDNPVFPYAAKIREAAKAARDACNAYKESIKKVNSLKAESDICKSKLITKYSENIRMAQIQYDKAHTRFFPAINSSTSSSDEDDDKNDSNSSNNDQKKDVNDVGK